MSLTLVQTSQVDGGYVCPECNLPVCEEICAYGEEHGAKECKIFAALDEKIK